MRTGIGGRTRELKAVVAVFILVSLFNFNLIVNNDKAAAQAATNLINGGSFENNIADDWTLWTGENSIRTYEVYRTYGDVAFGYGTNAAAIEAQGAPEQRWYVGFAINDSFVVDAAYDYYFIFYARASQTTSVTVFIEDAISYAPTTIQAEEAIGTAWERHAILFSPTQSGNGLLTFTLGDLPQDSTLYLDGVQLYRSDMDVSTKEVKGYIGDVKAMNITNINVFNEEDVEVELPYYAGAATALGSDLEKMIVKRFRPDTVTARGLTFTMPKGTFSGFGTVYVSGNPIGNFTYNVTPRITEIIPAMPRADEDLTVIGTGFHPAISQEKTYVVLKTIGLDGKAYEYWAQPDTIDSDLTQITISTPYGIMNSSLYIQTSFFNNLNENVVNKSNSINYKVKPIVYSASWAQRGYDQVGDKLRIRGKGISYKPTVTYYDMDGNKIETKTAKLVEISDAEYIEVAATTKINLFRIAVSSGGVESDAADIIDYSAAPKLTSLKTKYSRTLQNSGEKIYATKVGETITLTGVSLNSNNETYVDFQGVYGRIRVPVNTENISITGVSLTVEVPQAAANGFVSVEVNGVKSNYLPLEIVPTIVDVIPNPIVAGANMTISATGVGLQIFLSTVTFKTGEDIQKVKPEYIWHSDGLTYIQFKAPLNISSQSTSLEVEYDRWSSGGAETVTARPTILSAGINMDTKILSIRGYGFSILPKANTITYMNADEGHTVRTPKVKVLGVYPTDEGQEIRVQMLDVYHYGYVKVTVDGQTSNEVQFGPVAISRIARRVEYVRTDNRVRGVLYISGYNFGEQGGVLVGEIWADIHYRNDFFIIAVVDEQYVNHNPVIIARE